MTNFEKYQSVFVESLNLNLEDVVNATQESVDAWDSIGHMSLVAVMEDTFGIELQSDDIVEFNSFNKGIELLEKYAIEI